MEIADIKCFSFIKLLRNAASEAMFSPSFPFPHSFLSFLFFSFSLPPLFLDRTLVPVLKDKNSALRMLQIVADSRVSVIFPMLYSQETLGCFQSQSYPFDDNTNGGSSKTSVIKMQSYDVAKLRHRWYLSDFKDVMPSKILLAISFDEFSSSSSKKNFFFKELRCCFLSMV